MQSHFRSKASSAEFAELIALGIKRACDESRSPLYIRAMVAGELADKLERLSRGYDRPRFMYACGIVEESRS